MSKRCFWIVCLALISSVQLVHGLEGDSDQANANYSVDSAKITNLEAEKKLTDFDKKLKNSSPDFFLSKENEAFINQLLEADDILSSSTTAQMVNGIVISEIKLATYYKNLSGDKAVDLLTKLFNLSDKIFEKNIPPLEQVSIFVPDIGSKPEKVHTTISNQALINMFALYNVIVDGKPFALFIDEK